MTTLTLSIEAGPHSSDAGPAAIDIETPTFSVGRNEAMDWVLPDPERFISGLHFEIVARDGRYVLIDRSTNGTFLAAGQKRLTEPHVIEDGDRFEVGSYIIIATLRPDVTQVTSTPLPSLEDDLGLDSTTMPPAFPADPQPTPNAPTTAPFSARGAPNDPFVDDFWDEAQPEPDEAEDWAPLLSRTFSAPAKEPKEDLLLRRVYFGTNRKMRDEVASHAAFGGERSDQLRLGYSDISIPKDRLAGEVNRPDWLRIWKITLPIKEREDAKKHFMEKETRELSEDAFRAELAAASKAGDTPALVYIHGFNNSFQQAMFRAAQLGEDLKFGGLAFAFSWPARGGKRNYVTDIDSARLAVGHLDRFLHMIAQTHGITTIHLVVHSMGNALLSHLMERSGTELSKREDKLIDQLILAAPDIDRDVFHQVADHFKRHAKDVTLYASSSDLALYASEKIRASYPRAGDVPAEGPLVIEGVDTMDVSRVETGLFGLKHSTYGDSDRVINDVLARIKGLVYSNGKEIPPNERLSNVDPVEVPGKGVFYRFQPARKI